MTKSQLIEITRKLVREVLTEAKPSSGLNKKQKSSTVKKARSGKDVYGGGFNKVEKAAEKEYGSKEAGQKVAAAAMWKKKAAKAHK